ncbi:TonB-dependent receptor family protein [Sediminibacterium sp. TEGAF015]|uniref:TonB-dependent receptor family protein n=1 Tax=Sediminibacterium sp. TEGAF015 TaxID=575378 RepID=UPI0021FB1454|nr:TonB-dependent receptor [Sediminibacterium sp. TEGAF015]BDQ13235.1 TonB-dependent receptor [Sediminibacterium sp. TEGAF015]
MKGFIVFILLVLGKSVLGNFVYKTDTVPVRYLDSVMVKSYINKQLDLPEINGTYLNTGKKTTRIHLTSSGVDISSKIGRQVFAKVPGVFVYDMDGTGNQINIATRGLDPHRGWEFNLRKDGIITNSDMYGYPASHYSMPLESIESIELVRGTGSLQYGAQFGGMLNYISKQPDSLRPFSFENINTIGSFQLLSTYNAISGTVNKMSYQAYHFVKSRNGYRIGEESNSSAYKISLTYRPTKSSSLHLEWSKSTYTYKIPGPLNDSMFLENPRQSTRNRNYFNPSIHLPFIKFNWALNSSTQLEMTSSAVLGERNSILFDKPASIRDSIVSSTGQYNQRQVDIDHFNSYTSEIRLMHHFQWLNTKQTIATGIQLMNNHLHRRQLGKGTTSSDFDLQLTTPEWGRDLHFKTLNLAFFIENRIRFTNQLNITAGVRVESGTSKMTGIILNYPTNKIPVNINHKFPLLAIGFQFNSSEYSQLYGGIAQSYRPVIFKDLIPSSIYETIDPTIKDVSGYNAEFGFKGSLNKIKWDINTFLLTQNNRFGTLVVKDINNSFITYRTNIGNSMTTGIEAYIEAEWALHSKLQLSLFTSTAWMSAKYKNAVIKTGNANFSIHNNKVESVPDITSRNGIGIRTPLYQINFLYSYVSSTYSDPLNTIQPTKETGAVGWVPAYGLVDINASIAISKLFILKVNINNVFNKQYFTKRPLFYPGPGLWPSDGLNFSTTISFKL